MEVQSDRCRSQSPPLTRPCEPDRASQRKARHTLAQEDLPAPTQTVQQHKWRPVGWTFRIVQAHFSCVKFVLRNSRKSILHEHHQLVWDGHSCPSPSTCFCCRQGSTATDKIVCPTQ